MQHHFNVEVATKYGVHSAILLDNFYYWIEKNRANGNNFFDGYYWTYNSKKALSELFPYLSEKQVRTAIENLVNDGILITGNYNEMKMDRTMWYSITKKGYELLGDCRTSLFDLPNLANASDFNGRAIPNNKHTDNKPDIKIGPDEPDIFSQETKSTMGCSVLEEEKIKRGTEGVGRVPAAKPKRSYNTKPLMQMEVENKKLTRQQKQQIKIRELLQQVVEPVYGPELYNILGDYLDMRINLHLGKVDKDWFQKEWDENIYPAIQKYSIDEIVTHIRTVVIPKQYKRCFISISGGESKRNNFNDVSRGYTKEELTRAEEQGRLAKEEAIKNGTYRREF